MGKDQKEKQIVLQYTTINHIARKKLGITNNEYCLADSYYHLSKNPAFQEKGCVAADQQIADFIGVTRRTIISLRKHLIAKGIVIQVQNPTLTGGYITTKKWWDEVVGVKILHSECEDISQGCEDISQGCEDSSHNNNIYNNTDNKTIKKNTASLEILADETIIQQLQEKFPYVNVRYQIDNAKDWLASKGVKRKDYVAFMRNWLRKADEQFRRENNKPLKSAPPPVIHHAQVVPPEDTTERTVEDWDLLRKQALKTRLKAKIFGTEEVIRIRYPWLFEPIRSQEDISNYISKNGGK